MAEAERKAVTIINNSVVLIRPVRDIYNKYIIGFHHFVSSDE